MDQRVSGAVAVAMAVLVVTGTIGPALAAGGFGEQRQSNVVDPSVVFSDDGAALDHRLHAYRILDQADAQRHLDALNATFEHVVDENRVNASQVFATDKRIVAQTQAHRPDVGEQLVASDRVLAETVVADAQRVREGMDRRNLSYDEAAVNERLANASAALQQGHNHVAGNASLVAAVESYHRAWRHAQRAMDLMQAAVEPQVEITRRTDPPHNGTIEYTVKGVVWDVRSHRMAGTLTLNGEQRSLALDTSTVPGENVTFSTTVTLEEKRNWINVSVSNPLEYVDYSRRPATPGGPGNGQQGNGPQGPSNGNETGPPDDRPGGPPDDRGAGPPDGKGGGPPDDKGGGPPDERGEGPPDDKGEGPPDDAGNGPSDDQSQNSSKGSGQGPPDEPGNDDPANDGGDGSSGEAGQGNASEGQRGEGNQGTGADEETGNGEGPGKGSDAGSGSANDSSGAETNGNNESDGGENNAGPSNGSSNSSGGPGNGQGNANALANDPGSWSSTSPRAGHGFGGVDTMAYGAMLAPPESDAVQVGFDVLKLDADGLPDRYEETVVGTDPLDTDSDSRLTARNESDVGTIDGAKDFDVDGLATYQEYRIGTDPLSNDTTGDGLEDGFQVLVVGTDPLVNDTDGDGVADAQEDPDGDGLTLLEEQEHGTHPRLNDTDGDGLTDGEEVHEYDTDPLDPDSDGDGLLDGEEIRLDQDPLAADSDGDGVPDGNETYTTTVTNDSSEVTVTATGEGVVADGLHVRHTPTDYGGNVTAGPMVRITNDTAVEGATVTMPIDEGVDLSATNVTIYTWDPDDEGWVPLETTVDAGNRTASATVSSFSYFAVMDEGARTKATSQYAQPGWPALETFDDLADWTASGNGTVSLDDEVVTVQSQEGTSGDGGGGNDGSGGDDGGSGGSGGGDYEPYDENWELPGTGPGGNDGDDGDGGDGSDDDGDSGDGGGSEDGSGSGGNDGSGDDGSGGGDSGGDGGSDDGSGDGDGTSGPTNASISRTVSLPETTASIAIQVRVKATTGGVGTAEVVLVGGGASAQVLDLGYGETTDGWVTRRISPAAGSFAGEEATLTVRTEGNATVQVEYVAVVIDSTGSGLPDAVERLDLRMPTGGPGVAHTLLDLDPSLADTDGDGLRDGEEVDVAWEIVPDAGEWTLYGEAVDATSHPGRVDTTGDGLTDSQQVEGWSIRVVDEHDDATALMDVVNDPDADENVSPFFETRSVTANPLVNHTDDDGLSDAREFALGTDPGREDTTGDGIDDDEALALETEDPTVFTTTGPEARLLWYNQASEITLTDLKWYFQYRYKVEDSVGIREFEISRQGTTFDSAAGGRANEVYRTSTRESFMEGAFTVLRGSVAVVEATDVYGNTRKQVLYSQTSSFGHALKDVSPLGAGMVSGASHFAAELPEFIWLAITDPFGVYDAFKSFVGQLGPDLIELLIESVQRTQHLDNPFNENPDSEEYKEYERGWYVGYGALAVAELALGLKALKGIASVSKLKQTLQTTANRVDEVKALVKSGMPRKTAKITREATDGGPGRDYTRLVRDLETAGAVKNVKQLAKDIGPRFEDLEPSHPQLGTFLQKYGDNGVEVINKLDDAFDAHPLLGAPDEITNRIIQMTADFDVNPSALIRVVDKGHNLKRLEELLRTKASGRWTAGRPGDRNANFNKHYSDHAQEWSPPLSKSEYRSKARTLANQRDGVEIYYQIGQDPSNLIVYNRAANEFVTLNAKGEIQTFHRPNPGQVGKLVRNGNAIPIKT